MTMKCFTFVPKTKTVTGLIGLFAVCVLTFRIFILLRSKTQVSQEISYFQNGNFFGRYVGVLLII